LAKSGKPWHGATQQRASAIKKGHTFHTSWEAKAKTRTERKTMLVREKALKDAVELQRQEEREAQEAKRKQREENEKRSSVVQVIKSTSSVKKLKRKQLRAIEKR